MKSLQPTSRPIDERAIHIPMESGLPPCLYIPLAVRDTNAIEMYVGRIVKELTPNFTGRALLVQAHEPEKPDRRMAIWRLREAIVLHSPMQVWVNVDYPPTSARTPVLFQPSTDHVMNRRVARLTGSKYLRIVPISKGANSSPGGLSEGWAAQYHRSPEMMEKNGASQGVVQYADLADIVKMLDIYDGGSLRDNVNDAQKLLESLDITG